MAIKTDRVEARLSPTERAHIEQAASIAGLPVSTFMVGAAVNRADEIITAATTTVVPADYFDRLVVALDEAEPTPGLSKAARRSHRSPRIIAR
ncbi:MAG TPA: DUF1778 domain-containing protein [Acidimicrobiales bacterium]|nr:DUF1778 domain-containing protein [Acidimicrobiales bacterium]